MDRYYRTGQFARKVSVSERTLRYYDQVGLLRPTKCSDSGYRLYTDNDLVSLQQILALKFLGFSLDEIKVYVQSGPDQLRTTLSQQKAMMKDRRRQLDTIIQAIEETEKLLRADQNEWESVVRVIQAIQMEQKEDWRRKYFTEEQLTTMAELGENSYSEEAGRRMKEVHGDREWTEADQRRVDERYNALYAGVKRLVAEGGDPASPEAQELAGQSIQLMSEFTRNDPEIEQGLRNWWKNYDELADERKPFTRQLSDEESAFLEEAKAIYRERQAGS